MLSKQGLLGQMCLDKSCECSIVPQTDSKDNLFLAALSPTHPVGRHPQVFRKQQVQNKARKSLKPQRAEKQNRLSSQPFFPSCQQKTTSSNSLLIDSKFQDHQQLFSENRELSRQPLSNIQNITFHLPFSSNTISHKQENVESRIIQPTPNTALMSKNPHQIRFSQNYWQIKMAGKGVSEVKPKLDRAQSSGSFLVPKLKLNEIVAKRGAQWRSQFVNAQLEKSTSKLTHRLTDLNFKCTESVNDSESLKISEVVSDSDDTSRSDTNRTETLPMRIKDLMHMKYSKMQGKKY